METKRLLALVGVACLYWLLFPVLVKGDMIGIDGMGDVYSINVATGEGTRVARALPFIFTDSMAIHPSGIVYSTGLDFGYTDETYLIAIDPATWTVGYGPRLAVPGRALTFSPSGTLFTVRKLKSAPSDQLYTLDVATGESTLVGDTGLALIQGLDFGPDGTLYGYDIGSRSVTGAGLVTLDPLTGAASDVDPAVEGSRFDVQTIAFGADGTLYGAHDSLFSVDVNTGALTLIGSGEYSDIRGMVWIPEPSTLAGLLTMAAMALVAHLCRRKRKWAG